MMPFKLTCCVYVGHSILMTQTILYMSSLQLIDHKNTLFFEWLISEDGFDLLTCEKNQKILIKKLSFRLHCEINYRNRE